MSFGFDALQEPSSRATPRSMTGMTLLPRMSMESYAITAELGSMVTGQRYVSDIIMACRLEAICQMLHSIGLWIHLQCNSQSTRAHPWIERRVLDLFFLSHVIGCSVGICFVLVMRFCFRSTASPKSQSSRSRTIMASLPSGK